jgi:hypothetical protein
LGKGQGSHKVYLYAFCGFYASPFLRKSLNVSVTQYV